MTAITRHPLTHIAGFHPDLARAFEAAAPCDQAMALRILMSWLFKDKRLTHEQQEQYLTAEQRASHRKDERPIANQKDYKPGTEYVVVNLPGVTPKQELFIAPVPYPSRWSPEDLATVMRALRAHYSLRTIGYHITSFRSLGRDECLASASCEAERHQFSLPSVPPKTVAALIDAESHRARVRVPTIDLSAYAQSVGPHKITIELTPSTLMATTHTLTIPSAVPIDALTETDVLSVLATAARARNATNLVANLTFTKHSGYPSKRQRGPSDPPLVCDLFAMFDDFTLSLFNCEAGLASAAFQSHKEAYAEGVTVWTEQPKREDEPPRRARKAHQSRRAQRRRVTRSGAKAPSLRR